MAYNLVFDGDSLTAGYWNSLASGNYPQQVCAALNVTPVNNLGVGGERSDEIAARGAAADALYVAGRRNVYVLWCGYNDFNQSVAVGTLETNFQGIVAARQAAGFEVWALTWTPSTYSGQPPGFDTYRATFNAWLISGASGADRVVDSGSALALSNTLDTNYYNVDQLHLETNGYTIVAGVVAGALRPAPVNTGGAVSAGGTGILIGQFGAGGVFVGYAVAGSGPVTFNWIGRPSLADGPEATTSELLAIVGSDIYAFLGTDSEQAYKSSDGGVTWAAVGSAAPHSARITQVRTVGTVIRCIAPYDGGLIERADFNTADYTWSGVTSGFTGEPTENSDTVITGRSSGPYCFTQPDGDDVVVYQRPLFPSGPSSAENVRLIKDGPSNFDSIPLFDAVDAFRVMSVGMNDTGWIFAFVSRNNNTTGDVDLYFQLARPYPLGFTGPGPLIESDMELPGSYASTCVSTGRVAFDPANAMRAAFIYAKDAFSDFGGTPEIKAAIVEWDPDTLTSTVTVESIAAYTDNGSGGANANTGATFEGGSTLKAYWIDADGSGYNLYRSERTAPGTWSTPAKMFADQGDTSWHGTFGANLFGFDLIDGVAGTARGRNFASTGAFAQHGSYAAA